MSGIKFPNKLDENGVNFSERDYSLKGEGGSGGHVTDVKSFGAIGDGITDDTDAIYSALEASKNENGVLYFPSGTYLVSRSINIESNMVVTGAKNSKLTKPSAVTQDITIPLNSGDTVIAVTDSSEYVNKIGYDFLAVDMDNVSPANGTRGKIISVNEADNTITIESYDGIGIRNPIPTGNAKFTTSFAIIGTNGFRAEGENITIDGLTIDSNAQPDEPEAWVLAPIHIDPQQFTYNQSKTTVINNTIMNSPTDGISVQSKEDCRIENNNIENVVQKGIHVGTTINRVLINNNILKNCQETGMFYCFGINEVVFTNNIIVECQNGITGLDGDGNETIISHNIFDKTVLYSLRLSGKKGVSISDNIFTVENSIANSASIYVDTSSFVNITNNQFIDLGGSHATFNAIYFFRNDSNVLVEGNYFNYELSNADIVIELDATCDNIKLLNNTIETQKTCIDLNDVTNSMVNENLLKTSVGEMSIAIGATCENIRVSGNHLTGIFQNLGTNIIINGVLQDDLGGTIPDPSKFLSGDKVIDTSNNQILQLGKDGFTWLNITNNIIDSLSHFYNEGVEETSIIEGINTGGTYTENANDINLLVSLSGAEVSAVTAVQIDLTNIDTLYVDWENNGTASNYNYSDFRVTTNSDGFNNVLASLYERQQFSRKTTALDVSSVTGNAYIGVTARSVNASVSSNLTIHKISYLDLTKSNFIDLPLGEELTPVSSTATGIKGQVKWDVSYIYICVADNTWKRSPLTTW